MPIREIVKREIQSAAADIITEVRCEGATPELVTRMITGGEQLGSSGHGVQLDIQCCVLQKRRQYPIARRPDSEDGREYRADCTAQLSSPQFYT